MAHVTAHRDISQESHHAALEEAHQAIVLPRRIREGQNPIVEEDRIEDLGRRRGQASGWSAHRFLAPLGNAFKTKKIAIPKSPVTLFPCILWISRLF